MMYDTNQISSQIKNQLVQRVANKEWALGTCNRVIVIDYNHNYDVINNAFPRNFYKTWQKTPNHQCFFFLNKNYVYSRRPRGNFPYYFIM